MQKVEALRGKLQKRTGRVLETAVSLEILGCEKGDRCSPPTPGPGVLKYSTVQKNLQENQEISRDIKSQF